MDPEQVYQEVLQEEQQKGSSPAVAEGRAKAARVRVEHGSPHPKEPRWWPGAQPHLEGGDGAAPAEEPAAEEVEQPAAEAPAEAPAEEAAASAPAAAEQPAAEAPAPAEPAPQQPVAPVAEQPAAQAPAQQPAAVATVTEATPAPAATVGVAPGTPSGNRLRPEDAVSTEAQFDGQRAMQQRRKLIDELVATGVPSVTAAETGRERSPWISVFFLVIPLVAVLLIVSNSDSLGGGSEASEETASGGESAPAEGTVVAEQTQFNTDTIELAAGEPASIPFENKDPLEHNIAIYENASDAEAQENAIFDGDLISASTTTYEFEAPPAGEYVFQCDLHAATMSGTVVVE